VEPTVEGDDLEARIVDCTCSIPRRFAAAERACPEQGIARALEHLERAVAGANVFPEAELTAEDKHSVELSKRGARVGHATEKPHDDGGVEHAVLCRQRGGIAIHDVDRDPRRVGAPCGGRACRRVGLDGQQAFDCRRVVLERAAVATADLDHPSAQSAERLTTELARDRIGPAKLSPLEVSREARLLRPVEGDRYVLLRSMSSMR
jgi:hypothetical protein